MGTGKAVEGHNGPQVVLRDKDLAERAGRFFHRIPAKIALPWKTTCVFPATAAPVSRKCCIPQHPHYRTAAFCGSFGGLWPVQMK